MEGSRGHVKNHHIPSFGKRQLAALTPHHVEAMMNAKIEEGLSPRTVA
jgi:hypothetical protein